MHRALRFVALASMLAAGWPVAATAASFDCAKASTPREKTICGDAALSRADDELAAAYKGALAGAEGNGAAYLRAEQRRWLREQARNCRTDAACLRRDYELRIAYMRNPALRHSGRYVLGRCPGNGWYLDATPNREGKLDLLLYACPDPKGNVFLQGTGLPDAAGALPVVDSPACKHQLTFAPDTITLKAVQGPVCGSAYQANGVYRRDPAKSPFEGE